MEIIGLLSNKLFVMLIFMITGVILFRKNIITEAGSECLASLLIHLILPCVIVNGFMVEKTHEKLNGFLISAFMSVLILSISILVARICFRNNPIGHFASAFSNPGFFGIPLIAAILDWESVFYIAPFIACLNILQWTYGVSILKSEKIHIDIKAIIKSPFTISFAIGIALFLSQIPVPSIFKTVISEFAGLNTPVAMIVSGVYLAKANIRLMLTRIDFYKISFVRLLLIPAISILLLCMVPNIYTDVKFSLCLAASCPVGSNVAVYAQMHHKNYVYAV